MFSRLPFPRGIIRTGAIRLGLLALVSLSASTGFAQPDVCRQIAAELAALPRGGGASVGLARQSAQARQRLGQVQSTMAALGCNRGFVLFGSPPPPECGGLRAEAASLQGSIAQLNSAANQGNSGQRRMQLMASYDAYDCRNAGRAAPARAARVQVDPPQAAPGMGFLEAIFGSRSDAPRYATPEDYGAPLVDPDAERKALEDKAKKAAYGGSLPICVRTCDGFFFPVNYRGSEDQHEDVCRASCPGAETRVFWMSAGADLDTARARDGVTYNALPAAYSYRKAYDATCSCKAPQQTWASVLQKAEALIRERGTVTVTEETSLKMSRPAPARGLRGVRDPEEKAEPQRTQAATRGLDPMEGPRDAMQALSPEESVQKSIRVVAPSPRPRAGTQDQGR